MKSRSLSDAINSGEDLSEEIRAELFALLSSRCRADTRDKLARRIAVPISLWPNHGIYRRVHFDASGVSYCAGQSYPDEIRLVRQLILKG